MPKIITLIGLIAVLTDASRWRSTLATDAFALDVVEFTARSWSGWAIIDEEAKVRVEETEAGPVLWLSHRRLAAVSEVACKAGLWPIWVQPEAQLR